MTPVMLMRRSFTLPISIPRNFTGAPMRTPSTEPSKYTITLGCLAKVAPPAEGQDGGEHEDECGDRERADQRGGRALAHVDSLSAARVKNAWTRGLGGCASSSLGISARGHGL